MAKVKGPLHSLEAEGMLADVLVFRGGPGPTRVSKPGRSSKRFRRQGSPAQRVQRAAYQSAVRAWRDLGEAERAAWQSTARRTAVTGYNLFLSAALGQADVIVDPPPQEPQPDDALRLYPRAGTLVVLDFRALSAPPVPLETTLRRV
jgi:hypothetical protein